MELVVQSPRALRCVDSRRREALAILLFLLLGAIFLFADTIVPPVALRDEARNAVNAIEMYLTGPSLITTFGFRPDLWNTKPPLMIWLMSASMTLFGPSEWALRLPSALAGMGILCCTLFFVRRVTGSLATAIMAAAILLFSPGFFGEHGARTADFDATLTFFITASLQLVFFAVHRRQPSMWWMLAIGALVASAALTKTVAAFIPLTGVLLYLIAIRRFRRALSASHRYAVAGTAAIAPLLIFYAFREAVSPGYVSTVIHNDIVGRFSEELIAATGPFYYVTELSFGWFLAGPFLVGAPLALASLSGRSRLLFLYAGSIATASLLVYSAASNRALQYALPMYPWLAIVAALTLRYLVQFLAGKWQDGRKALVIVAAAALVFVSGQVTYRAAYWRYQGFPERQFYPQSSYGDLFAELSDRGVSRFTVIDPGQLHHGTVGYAPLLRWNRLIWQEKGLIIDHELKQSVGADQATLASCEPNVLEQWNGPGFEKIGECGVLWQKLKV